VKVAKKFLKGEWQKAMDMATTPLTGFDNCVYCGSCKASELVQLKGQWEEARKSVPEEIEGDENAIDRERNFRYRVSFQKLGVLRFVSHLDLTKTMRLAFKRADIPVSFSRGFHPVPQISFGPALPMNVESNQEYLDFYTYRFIDPDECVRRINEQLPAGLQFLEAVQIAKSAPALSVLISGADYKVDFSQPVCEPVLREYASRNQISVEDCHGHALEEYERKSELLFTKHKTGKVVNIKDFVRSLNYDKASKALHVEMKIVEGSTVSILQVVKSLYQIDVELPITRTHLYFWKNGYKQSPLEIGVHREDAEIFASLR
jgi:radical SAM-linked protein